MSIKDDQLETLCKLAYKMTGIKKGEVLIQQGDLFADKFYIVDKGSFTFSVSKKSSECETDLSGEVGKVRAGGSSFGELALLYPLETFFSLQAARSGSWRCCSPTRPLRTATETCSVLCAVCSSCRTHTTTLVSTIRILHAVNSLGS